MRLDRYLVHGLAGSRHEVRGRVLMGCVTVDGKIERSPKTQIAEDTEVCLDGERIVYKENRYIMLHKPSGVVTARSDKTHDTVMDLLDEKYRRLDLSPVGRLDIDTTGLLLITDDGALAHRLLAPKSHVPKVYLAEVDQDFPGDCAERFAEGIRLGDMVCQSAGLEIVGPRRARITIYEGKYHQVKRMLAACGLETLSLARLSMGALSLDESLRPGESRELTWAEEVALKGH